MTEITHYNHGHLFSLAEKAYERAKEDCTESLSSIIISVIAFETFLNEFKDVIQRYQSESDTLLSLKQILDNLEDEKASTILKTQMIYYHLTHELLDKGASPFQDYCQLTKIRNALIHKKPEKYEWEPDDADKIYKPHNFTKFLADRGIIQKPHENNPPSWYQYVVQPEVARWAYNVCIKMLRCISQNIPDEGISKQINFMSQNLKEL